MKTRTPGEITIYNDTAKVYLGIIRGEDRVEIEISTKAAVVLANELLTNVGEIERTIDMTSEKEVIP